MKRPPHIVFIGPSGAGKSTLASLTVKKRPDITRIKTYTTRPRRGPDDDSHIFVDAEEFKALEERKAFIGTLSVFDALYGLPALPDDQQCLLLLRAPVVTEFKKSYPESIIIEIDAPVEVLEQRLKKRHNYDRLDNKLLAGEIRLGRQQADLVVDTSQAVDVCLTTIERYIDG